MNFRIEKYHAGWQDQWNRCVEAAPVGFFLHNRHYMDYHSERFEDFSLLILQGNELIGCVPAHRTGNRLFSHSGLSFGGWLMRRNYSPAKMREIWRLLLSFLKENNIDDFRLTTAPFFFRAYLSAYDDYIFREFGKVEKTARHWMIDTRKKQDTLLNADRRRSLKKLPDLRVEDSTDWESFWPVLEANLKVRHSAVPVHSLDEIRLLHGRFPRNIRLKIVRSKKEIIGGAVLYDYGQTLHFQYIAVVPDASLRPAVDRLVFEIIRENYARYPFIGLGTSETPDGKEKSLSYWKYSLGAEPFPQYSYLFDVAKLDL